jgi:A/G-specific adenine glycosylase
MNRFLQKLFSWYDDNARDFPFRRTNDPYLIWLSEIIMQQTRIEQGVPYYNKFTEAFPAIDDLAAAGEDEVLKQWQGLGYYSRARNLHWTAKEIVVKYGGTFPGTYEEIRSLKGVGDYTASAIASVCFGLPCPVMDGNVIRFITRHFGIESDVSTASAKKEILAVLSRLMNELNETEVSSSSVNGLFNQAMIEFGAMYCIPRNPGCQACIFNFTCYAYQNGIVTLLPRKKQPKELRTRYLNYLVMHIHGKNGIYFTKRTGNDIWKGLYEFPLIETSDAMSPGKLMKSGEWQQYFRLTPVTVRSATRSVTHLLSHQKINARFIDLVISGPYFGPGELIPHSDIHKLPVPRLIEKYLTGETRLLF